MITRFIALSIIHTGANDSINEYEIISSSQFKSQFENDPNEHNDQETFYVLDNPDYQMTLMMILITLVTMLILLTLMTLMIMMILINIMTITHFSHDDHDDPDEYNDNETYSLIESSTPV